MTAQTSAEPGRPSKTRSRVVKPGRLPVSEFAADRAGAASPFGDDLTFPVPPERLTYEHPSH
jgi:succinate dehydrogenase / fumarate reductase iron-sulfur subunit